MHHLFYLVCVAPSSQRSVFTFCGLGQFKILDSRFILEFRDSITNFVELFKIDERLYGIHIIHAPYLVLTHLCSQKLSKNEF